MYLEIPDKELRIDNPSLEDVDRELSGMMPIEGGDNCLDLCDDDAGFVQAIGAANAGFFVRFKNRQGDIYQSRSAVTTNSARDALSSFLLSRCCPTPGTEYKRIN